MKTKLYQKKKKKKRKRKKKKKEEKDEELLEKKQTSSSPKSRDSKTSFRGAFKICCGCRRAYEKE